ncbi:hypothetical protein, partial [Acinetobacter baumannii]
YFIVCLSIFNGLYWFARLYLPVLVRLGLSPVMGTVQTTSNDPLIGYLPVVWSLVLYGERAKKETEAVVKDEKQ